MSNKTFRRKRGLSNVILFSIGEFAWLVVFFMLIVSNKLTVELQEAEQTIGKYQSRIGAIELHLKQGQDNEDYGEEIDKLNKKLLSYDNLEAELQVSQSKNAKLKADLSKAKQAQKVILSLRQEIEKGKFKATQTAQEIRTLEKDKNLLSQLVQEQSALSKPLKEQLGSLLNKELAIRQEIVGIKEENLKKVVFIFDRSSSMAEADGRWEAAQREVKIWLEYMPIQEIALIDFHSRVQKYPEEAGQFLRLRDNERTVNPENLSELLRMFSSTEVGGGTNTHLALRTAYTYKDATMIILFTDGKPNMMNGEKARSNYVMDKITDMVTSMRIDGQNIPIYSVAIGVYGEDQVRFLKGLAKITEGNFIGK
jgi:hypothetical protein